MLLVIKCLLMAANRAAKGVIFAIVQNVCYTPNAKQLYTFMVLVCVSLTRVDT